MKASVITNCFLCPDCVTCPAEGTDNGAIPKTCPLPDVPGDGRNMAEMGKVEREEYIGQCVSFVEKLRGKQ